MLIANTATSKRIYVASIRPELGQNEIVQVFEAFGEITQCDLAMDPLVSWPVVVSAT